MLAALLLAGLVAAPVSSAALFVPARGGGGWPGRGPRPGGWCWRCSAPCCWPRSSRRSSRAGRDPDQRDRRGRRPGRDEPAVAAGDPALERPRAPVLGGDAVPVRRATWSSCCEWTFASGLGVLGTAGGAAAVGARGCSPRCSAGAYLWELCDALGTRALAAADHAGRRRRAGADPDAPAVRQPARAGAQRAAGHGDRDADLAAARWTTRTTRSSSIDDNTDDESLWRPVEALVRGARREVRAPRGLAGLQVRRAQLRAARDDRPARRAHRRHRLRLPDRPGLPAPLRAAVRRPGVGFIQAPQDYRDWEQAPYYRRLYYSYKYFFAVSQPSRNERDGAIFAGTMGLIRREALEAASAAGTSGASPRTPSCRCGCCGPAGPGCTSTRRSATASCR